MKLKSTLIAVLAASMTASTGVWAACSANIDMGDKSITNLADPANAQDAATKAYVDAAMSAPYTVYASEDAMASGTVLVRTVADGLCEIKYVADANVQNMMPDPSAGHTRYIMKGTLVSPHAPTEKKNYYKGTATPNGVQWLYNLQSNESGGGNFKLVNMDGANNFTTQDYEYISQLSVVYSCE